MKSVIDNSLLEKTEKITADSVELNNFLEQLSQSADDNAIDRVISLYKKTILKLEKEIWTEKPGASEIKKYQNSFKVLEKLYELRTLDTRYNFKIIIPVADRPQHLKHCLNSLLTLCETYGYGGRKNNQFNKVSVLIADDSKHEKNIKLHQSYCTELNKKGIKTEYFGLDEQLTLTREALARQKDLSKIIADTEYVKMTGDFSHKGASIIRNITYLKLKHSLSQQHSENTLLYFIDSDQEFCINSTHAATNLYAINYFHYLDEIFSTQDIDILTGKVVGDPPVSPSVMAANFQQDVQSFLHKINELNPGKACDFHQHAFNLKDDAAYHDMANLFGFSNHEKAFDYHCPLPDSHNNIDCFYDFSNKMRSFFHGEHPTRKTYFNYEDGFSKTVAARTVYTGNYVIKPEVLDYFIPFATQKLRMAGPVLGRILKASLGERFVSANLPMLHKRTVNDTGQSEFRAGVDNFDDTVDLNNEFTRQFYGDVALFSMQKIVTDTFPDASLNSDTIKSIIDSTYKNIRQNYIEKHNTILKSKDQIQEQLDNTDAWWNQETGNNPKLTLALSNIESFLNNIQINFGEETQAYQSITKQQDSQTHLTGILNSILDYQSNMDNWKTALKQ
ncbi:MAG: hypothetical protein GQ549_03425 [Gammaproteobacteria bacterium]|nr:hypothetical protein [Gammaproteobacteria bacterium]